MKNKIIFAVIFIWLCALTAKLSFYSFYHENPMSFSTYENNAPKKEKIKKMIEPLRYNGLYRLMEPQVRIQPNFEDLTWTLKNVHRFSEDGNILLSRGRYGVCGDLAAYIFPKVKALLGNKYNVDFLVASESSFFKSGNSTHILLRIVEKNPIFQNKVYLLDPAFRKYGVPESLFQNYLPIQTLDNLDFLKKRDPDETFGVDGGPPIFVNRNLLFSLFVLPSNGKFDSQNFGVALTFCKRYNYLNEYIYTVMKSEGKVEVFENTENLNLYLPPGKYELIKKTIRSLFDRIEINENLPNKS